MIYIMQITPASPVVSPFVEPEPRTIPSTYPAPYLVRDGSIPVAIEWTVEPAGSAYQILFLTRDTLADVADGYREILRGQGLNITLDEAQGTATNIEFSSADNLMIGAISIDTFTEDDAYTEATVQVQAAPGFTPGTPPTAHTDGTRGLADSPHRFGNADRHAIAGFLKCWARIRGGIRARLRSYRRIQRTVERLLARNGLRTTSSALQRETITAHLSSIR